MDINKTYKTVPPTGVRNSGDVPSYISKYLLSKNKGISPKDTEISQQIKRPGTDFVSIPGSFMVAEAGLEPTTSGL